MGSGRVVPQLGSSSGRSRRLVGHRRWELGGAGEQARTAEEPGALTADERAELEALRKENTDLRMDREILRKAAAYFARETNR